MGGLVGAYPRAGLLARRNGAPNFRWAPAHRSLIATPQARGVYAASAQLRPKANRFVHQQPEAEAA